VVSDADIAALINSNGGTATQWTIVRDANAPANKPVVIIIGADASVVSADAATALEQSISNDSTFTAAGGTSSVKVNQTASSTAALSSPLLLAVLGLMGVCLLWCTR